jgi:hypothetical protein
MESNMIREEFWDEYEYNFFINLEDEDKLLYLYDILIGEFKNEYLGESDIELELEEDISEIKNDVLIMFDKYGNMSISGPSKEILIKTVNGLMMNGVILSKNSTSKLKDDTWVIQYKLIGNVPPISIN